MRLKAEIWIKAYLRRCVAEGAAAFVVRRGDSDAGTVFIRINRLDGTSGLYCPAPAGLADTSSGDRQWMNALKSDWAPDGEVEAHLTRELDFDPDVWIVEVEDRSGRHFLDGWLAAGSP